MEVLFSPITTGSLTVTPSAGPGPLLPTVMTQLVLPKVLTKLTPLVLVTKGSVLGLHSRSRICVLANSSPLVPAAASHNCKVTEVAVAAKTLCLSAQVSDVPAPSFGKLLDTSVKVVVVNTRICMFGKSVAPLPRFKAFEP